MNNEVQDDEDDDMDDAQDDMVDEQPILPQPIPPSATTRNT
jgi:hypothetical protein